MLWPNKDYKLGHPISRICYSLLHQLSHYVHRLQAILATPIIIKFSMEKSSITKSITKNIELILTPPKQYSHHGSLGLRWMTASLSHNSNSNSKIEKTSPNSDISTMLKKQSISFLIYSLKSMKSQNNADSKLLLLLHNHMQAHQLSLSKSPRI